MDLDDCELLQLWGAPPVDQAHAMQNGLNQFLAASPEAQQARVNKVSSSSSSSHEPLQQQHRRQLQISHWIDDELRTIKKYEALSPNRNFHIEFRDVCVLPSCGRTAEMMQSFGSQISRLRREWYDGDFYIGVSQNPVKRMIDRKYGHATRWPLMHLLAAGPSPRVGEIEIELLKEFRGTVGCHNVGPGGEGCSSNIDIMAFCYVLLGQGSGLEPPANRRRQ